MSCDRSAEVHAYYDGEMPRQQRATFEAHLADCADCRQVLAELRKVSELIAAAPLAEMSPMALARLQQSWFAAKDRGVMRIAGWLTAVAASILIAALLLWKRPGDEVPGRYRELRPAAREHPRCRRGKPRVHGGQNPDRR